MDTPTQPTQQPKTPIRVGLLIAVLVGLPIVVATIFSLFTPLYMCKAGVTIVSLTFAVAVIHRQRQISLSAVLLLTLGALFLTSGVVDYAYNDTVRPLPTLVEMEVHRVVDIKDLSRGLMFAGLGIGTLLPVFMGRKPSQNSPTKNPLWHGLNWLWMGFASVYFILAILSLADGFHGA